MSYDMANHLGLVAKAAADGVTIRDGDIVFSFLDGGKLTDDGCVGCLRKIGKSRVRLCGCWVAPSLRKNGLGKLLVMKRIEYATKSLGAKILDTFAFNTRLFGELGFVAKRDFRIGTTHMEKVLT